MTHEWVTDVTHEWVVFVTYSGATFSPRFGALELRWKGGKVDDLYFSLLL